MKGWLQKQKPKADVLEIGRNRGAALWWLAGLHQHEQLGNSILLYLLLQDSTAPQFMPRSEQQWGPPWDGICGYRSLGLWEDVNVLEIRETPHLEDELLAHPATILKSQTQMLLTDRHSPDQRWTSKAVIGDKQ